MQGRAPNSPKRRPQPTSSDARFVAVLQGGATFLKHKLQKVEANAALRSGKGIAFIATPSEGQLAPWSAVAVKVSCFGDIPQRYRDELIAKVPGLDVVRLSMRATVTGTPVRVDFGNASCFKRSAALTSQRPTLCFGCVMRPILGGPHERRAPNFAGKKKTHTHNSLRITLALLPSCSSPLTRIVSASIASRRRRP